MSHCFLVADTHFSHQGVCRFLRADGVTKLRPWTLAEEMDEALVTFWNETVRPVDKVYHLGDVAIPRRGLKVLERLNGRKVLIKGNHDIFQLSDYTPHFKDIRAYHILDRLILSHAPIHPGSLSRWKANVHGHLHANTVMETIDGGSYPDRRYINVSVEHTNWRPIDFEEVKALAELNSS